MSSPPEPTRPMSLNDPARLRLLRDEARRAASRRDADFIEMGVFRGGSALLLARELAAAGSPHLLHLLDSWEGPRPTTREDAGSHQVVGKLDATFDDVRAALSGASEEEVRELLAAHGVLDRCRTHRGWFEDTLPSIPGPFALAHVDCDFYLPVRQCLAHVLPRMAPGGVVVVDDYGVAGSRRFPGVERAVRESIGGTTWRIEPLGGAIDQSVRLVRSQG